MIRIVNVVLAVLLVVAILFKVGAIGAAAHHGKVENEKVQSYVLITSNPDDPRWTDTKQGLWDKAKELHVATFVEGPETADANQQIAAIDNAVERKVDGIIVVPASDAVAPAIDRAIAARIGVICIEKDAPSSKRYTFVGTDDHALGVAAGRLLAKQLGGKGVVAIVSDASETAIADGYRAELLKSSGITLAQKQPLVNVSGIACTSPAGAARAVGLVRKAGESGKVTIVTVGADASVLSLIQSGAVVGAIDKRCYTMSYLALQMLFDLRNDRVKLVPDWRKVGVVPLPLTADTGCFAITKENVRYFKHK